MKEWLLSVSAVVLTLVLLEIILSEGKVKKYVQGIVRLALVVTMVLPIIRFIKSDSDFNFVVDDNQSAENIVDNNFLERVRIARFGEVEKGITAELQAVGISNAETHISIYYNAYGSIEVDLVTIDLTNAVITEDYGNILLNEKLKAIVKKRLTVSEEKIIIYGVA